MAESGGRWGAALSLALAFGAVGALALWLLSDSQEGQGPSGTALEAPAAERSARSAAGSQPGSPPGSPPGSEVGSALGALPLTGLDTMSIRSGETLELPYAALPRRGQLVVNLLMPAPSASQVPLKVRVIGEDSRVYESQGVLDPSDPRRAATGIDAAWLKRGRFVIELMTKERSHFPLRRYALEIR